MLYHRLLDSRQSCELNTRTFVQYSISLKLTARRILRLSCVSCITKTVHCDTTYGKRRHGTRYRSTSKIKEHIPYKTRTQYTSLKPMCKQLLQSLYNLSKFKTFFSNILQTRKLYSLSFILNNNINCEDFTISFQHDIVQL